RRGGRSLVRRRGRGGGCCLGMRGAGERHRGERRQAHAAAMPGRCENPLHFKLSPLTLFGFAVAGASATLSLCRGRRVSSRLADGTYDKGRSVLRIAEAGAVHLLPRS